MQLDTLAAETAACMTIHHPHYDTLAARISVSNLHKETPKRFSTLINSLYHNPKQGPLVSKELYSFVVDNKEEIDSSIIYERDFELTYSGFKTLERSYLLKINGVVAERPQHMFMRVAIGIHLKDDLSSPVTIKSIVETYNLMSSRYYTHATPTLFNAGVVNNNLSSCYLIHMNEDSIDGIFKTLNQAALISKSAGGIGLSIQNIRSKDSYIHGTQGSSNGIIPMLRVFNDTARYVDQGGNKRPGAFAVYLEPWHDDIFEFLDLRKNTGKEEARARDLFLGLWIPDLFMVRVEADASWTLFSPSEAPGLDDVYGKEFEDLYVKYENEQKGRRSVPARTLWMAIISAQVETGVPYMLFKDACNKKSNQSNLGTIKCSNLCTEIIQYSSPEETAVCNLASLVLPTFINTSNNTFDFTELHRIVKIVVRNLNRVIDVNKYPVLEALVSNMKHRPIGVGVQGLADVFIRLRFPFESDEARLMNIQIFETIYHAALESSCDLARELGHTYKSYPDSPVSRGILQYHMWGVKPTELWDWDSLQLKIAKHGLINSLLIAPMPTASTSTIMGSCECFEPITSNFFTRRTSSGEFQVVNRYLVNDLVKLGIWSENLRDAILVNNGSIQECMYYAMQITLSFFLITKLTCF